MDCSNNLNESASEKCVKVPKRKFVIEDVILTDSEKLEPCLVQFTNGVVMDQSEIRGKLYRNASEKYKHKRSRRILQASTSSDITYTGKNFDGAFDRNFKQRNFLGVLDRNTNKMKLIEVGSFLLHPDTNSTITSKVNFLSTLSISEKRRELNTHFGGRRARALIRRKDNNQFDIVDMTSALNVATKTVDVSEELEVVEEEISYKEILPPCDKDALLIKYVYKLEDIIPDVELVLYNDDAMEYLDGNKTPKNFSMLFHQTLLNAKLSTDEEEAAKIACVALFTENLIQLLKTKPRTEPKLVDCPKSMASKIFTTFSQGKFKRRTKSMEDKLIAHIIVLALLANQLELEWTALCRSLGVQKDRLTNLLCVVGATLNRSKGSVKLKLPLAKFNFRPTSIKKAKQRR